MDWILFISKTHKQHLGGNMAGGWAKDGAVQDQIDASVEDAVARAKNNMYQVRHRGSLDFH